MQRKAKKTFFKYIVKLLVYGTVACVLVAFLGPCLSTRIGLDYEKRQDSWHIKDSQRYAALPDLSDGRRHQKSAFQNVKGVPSLDNISSHFVTKIPAKVPPLQENAVDIKSDDIKPVKFDAGKLLPRTSSKDFDWKLIERSNGSLSNISISYTTTWHQKTQLEDIFIGVKTSSVYHKTRLNLLLETWITKAQNQTYMFTDDDDEEFKQKVADGHLINTHCGKGHTRESLCCKMGFEFDVFIKEDKRWFCAVDDDNYLNVDNLVAYLQKYNPDDQDVYTGFTQLRGPVKTKDTAKPEETFNFYFGTGGAGVCISKSLVLKMAPYVCNGTFVKVCDRIRWPDDMAVGFVVEVLTNNSLIREARFNSHMESIGNMRTEQLAYQITLSYSIDKSHFKTIHIPKGAFNTTVDPTRFRSLHCMLYPDSTDWCPKI